MEALIGRTHIVKLKEIKMDYLDYLNSKNEERAPSHEQG